MTTELGEGFLVSPLPIAFELKSPAIEGGSGRIALFWLGSFRRLLLCFAFGMIGRGGRGAPLLRWLGCVRSDACPDTVYSSRETATQHPFNCCESVSTSLRETLIAANRPGFFVDETEAVSSTTLRARMMLAVQKSRIDSGFGRKDFHPSTGRKPLDLLLVAMFWRVVSRPLLIDDRHYATSEAWLKFSPEFSRQQLHKRSRSAVISKSIGVIRAFKRSPFLTDRKPTFLASLIMLSASFSRREPGMYIPAIAHLSSAYFTNDFRRLYSSIEIHPSSNL